MPGTPTNLLAVDIMGLFPLPFCAYKTQAKCILNLITKQVRSVYCRLPREILDAPTIPGGVQGQVGWGPGQPGLVLHVEVGGPTCGRRVGASCCSRSLPRPAIL